MLMDWMSDLREAYAILGATRSQDSVVSTHSLDRFIWDGHIVTRGTSPRGRAYLSYRVGWIAYGNWGGGISLLGRYWQGSNGNGVQKGPKSLLSGAVWDSFGPVEIFEARSWGRILR